MFSSSSLRMLSLLFKSSIFIVELLERINIQSRWRTRWTYLFFRGSPIGITPFHELFMGPPEKFLGFYFHAEMGNNTGKISKIRIFLNFGFFFQSYFLFKRKQLQNFLKTLVFINIHRSSHSAILCITIYWYSQIDQEIVIHKIT